MYMYIFGFRVGVVFQNELARVCLQADHTTTLRNC